MAEITLINLYSRLMQHPYPTGLKDSSFQSNDAFNRNHHQLLTSLGRFGHLILTEDISIQDDTLREIIPSLVNFCNNETTPDDFKVLLRTYRPPAIKTRIIYRTQMLDESRKSIGKQLSNLDKYEQALFSHALSPDNYLICLVLPVQGLIEVVFVGDSDFPEVQSILKI
jgi:hypothetical protein